MQNLSNVEERSPKNETRHEEQAADIDLDFVPGFQLNLPVNVGPRNIFSLSALLDDFRRELRGRNRVDISLMRARHTRCRVVGARVAGLVPPIHRLPSEAPEKGHRFAEPPMPTRRTLYDPADCRGSLQIGPGGSLNKCSPGDAPWAGVGKTDKAGTPVLGTDFERSYADDDLPDRCMMCEFLCICDGGCRIVRLRRRVNANCNAPYARVDQMMVNLYRHQPAVPMVPTRSGRQPCESA